MRSIALFGLMAAIVYAAPANAQSNTTAPACSLVVFGRHCESTEVVASRVDGRDYGYVELGISQPAIAAITQSNRRAWRDTVRRYFVPRAQSGQIVVKIYLQDGTERRLLATVPVVLFSVSEKDGVVINEDVTFSAAPIRVTPYFRLTQDRYSIFYEVEMRSSDQPASLIVDRMRQATQVATDFGGSGWLSDAMGSDAIVGRLQRVESGLVAPFTATATSTVRGYLTPHRNAKATYQLSLVPNTPPTGAITIQFRRLTSLFADQARPDARLPAYNVQLATQNQRFLTYRATTSQTIDDLLESKVTSQGWSALADDRTAENVFAGHCATLSQQVQGELDLSEHDATAVLWAALNRGNMSRRAIRELDCVKRQEPAFALLSLPMPTVPPAPPPGPPVPPPVDRPATVQASAIQPAKLSQNELSRVMERLFTGLNMPAEAPGKTVFLESQFSDLVRSTEDFQVPNDFPAIGSQESAGSLSTHLSRMSFTLSCFSRASTGEVTFFGRRTDPGTYKGALWRFSVVLVSAAADPTPSTTQVGALSVREVRDADFEAARVSLAGKPECHTVTAVP